MQLKIADQTRLVPMLVDTGSPSCFIDVLALQKFGLATEDPYPEEHVEIEIAGREFEAVVVKPGVENQLLKGLNIMGMDAIRLIVNSHGETTIERTFVDAFNGPDPLRAAKLPRRAQPDQEDDQDVLRSFFRSTSTGVELVQEVLKKVAGRDLSAPIFDKVRPVIERCKPQKPPPQS